MIRIGSLKPLDNFLAFLTTFPDPDATCTALLRGPLSPLAAKVGSLWSHSGDDELTMIGAHLHTASARDRYGRVSMQVDLPVVRCISNGEMEVHDLHTITTTFPALALDSSIWQTISDQSQARYIVSQPIFSAGVTIGAISFASGQSRGFIESYAPILSSISSALALWMTHQRMPSALRPATYGAEPVDALRLTPRQRQILLLVAEGKSNASIAYALGYSLSTVKQELQRALNTLRVNGRLAAVERARELGLLEDAS